MKYISLMSLGLVFSMTSFAQESAAIFEGWKGFSNPEIMLSGFTAQFSELPKETMLRVGPTLWSGDYWAHKKGGINFRWNSPALEGFSLRSPNKEFALNMSQDQLALLAPSEKYDLYMGRYDYPLKREVAEIVSPKADEWEGICNGWAPASMNHMEPSPKVLTNPDGIKVPFGSSDIKAILSYYYAYHNEVESTHQMGLRCGFGGWMGGSKACDEDLNAGAFHIVLTNKVGLLGESFVMDKDRKKEVWNQPVVGYKTRILGSKKAGWGAAKTAVTSVRVATELFFVNEYDKSSWEKVIGTEFQQIKKLDLEYLVELDGYGNIVGGEWESKDRPDFIWTIPRALEFKGMFSGIPALLDD